MGLIEESLNYFQEILEEIDEDHPELITHISFDIMRCYYDLGLYEDSLKYSEAVLRGKAQDSEALHIKAKCLAMLGEFDESVSIFKSIGQDFEIDFVNQLIQ